MGNSKSELFPDSINQKAKIFKALGHPARIAIIEYLKKVESCICNEIVEYLPLAQSTISQHLKELKKANLIKGTIEGPKVCYCLDRDTFAAYACIIQEFLSYQEKITTKCC